MPSIVLLAQFTGTQDRFHSLSYFGHPVTNLSHLSQREPNSLVLASGIGFHYVESSYRVMLFQQNKVFKSYIEIKRITNSAARFNQSLLVYVQLKVSQQPKDVPA